jgi:hypothetical protein
VDQLTGGERPAEAKDRCTRGLPPPCRPGSSPFRRKEKNDGTAQELGQVAGLVLHTLIGGLMMVTGWEKVLGLVPPEALGKYGLAEQVRLIGAGHSSQPSSC